MSALDTLILDQAAVRSTIAAIGLDTFMDRLIDRLAAAFAAVGEGRSPMSPLRGGFPHEPSARGVMEWMPHRAPTEGVTVKLISYSPDNPRDHGLPTILGTIARFEDATGHLRVLTDGVILTAMRTGATSAVASRLLARSDSQTLGIVGAGAQAVAQAHAVSRVFDVREILVCDSDPAHAEPYAERISFLDTKARVTGADEVAAISDIICTATSVLPGSEPVLPDANLHEHVHVNAVGSDVVGKVELPRTLLNRALVVPDNLAQALREGECQRVSPACIGPGLAEICAEPALVEGRRDSTTVFDSTGLALEDHVALDVLLDGIRALEADGPTIAGVRVLIESHPADLLAGSCRRVLAVQEPRAGPGPCARGSS